VEKVGKEEQFVLLDRASDLPAILIAVVRRTRLSAGIVQERVRVQILVPEIPVGFAMVMIGSLLEHHRNSGDIAELGIQRAAGDSELLQSIGGREGDQAETIAPCAPAIRSILYAHAVQIPIVASPIAAARDHCVAASRGGARRQADQRVDRLS
jgi:hypothetical protein